MKTAREPETKPKLKPEKKFYVRKGIKSTYLLQLVGCLK